MKILAVASEMTPLIKTGGLADVVGALPAALAPHRIQVTTLLPAYPQVLERAGKTRVVGRFPDLFGAPARLLSAKLKASDGSGPVRLLLLDAPLLLARHDGPYADSHGVDWPDNWRRFAALSLVAADLAGGGLPAFRPDLVHAHDWQAALALAYMRHGRAPHVPAMLTIHNLAFQGRFPADVFPALGLPAASFSIDGVEYYGGVGYLKAGIVHADAITTVSPTYAAEITGPEFGMGLEGLIRARGDVLHGIVNGIETSVWNPTTDPLIAATYNADSLGKRAANKAAVVERFSLDADNSPLFVVITRLTWQKGMDLLAEVADDIARQGARLAIIGTGEPAIEAALNESAHRHPGRIATIIGYDEPLSHLMQAGGDAILVPSRFEPCGLTQLYGLRYGCVPVVARTGGLADTIIDANIAALAAGVATGIQCAPGSADSLRAAITRAIALHADQAAWTSLQQRGMQADFSWKASARRYAALCTSLVNARKAA